MPGACVKRSKTRQSRVIGKEHIDNRLFAVRKGFRNDEKTCAALDRNDTTRIDHRLLRLAIRLRLRLRRQMPERELRRSAGSHATGSLLPAAGSLLRSSERHTNDDTDSGTGCRAYLRFAVSGDRSGADGIAADLLSSLGCEQSSAAFVSAW